MEERRLKRIENRKPNLRITLPDICWKSIVNETRDTIYLSMSEKNRRVLCHRCDENGEKVLFREPKVAVIVNERNGNEKVFSVSGMSVVRIKGIALEGYEYDEKPAFAINVAKRRGRPPKAE